MDQITFGKYKKLIYEKSGITLGPQKIALVTARISKRMRALGIETHKKYLDYVLQQDDGVEIIQLLDAISTNVTSFYREPDHFEILSKLITEWRNEGQKKFRIWCAAASTGEEPYCLAMTALEALKGGKFDLRILATDISTRVLAVCKRGEYPDSKVGPIPISLRKKYFQESRVNGERVYTASQKLKDVLSFNRLNLSVTPFPMKGPLDAVFCRNVMIYFDNDIRTKLLMDAHRLLKPKGHLMIGHSESLSGIDVPFKSYKPAAYIKL